MCRGWLFGPRRSASGGEIAELLQWAKTLRPLRGRSNTLEKDMRNMPARKQVRIQVEAARDHAFTRVILKEGGSPLSTRLVFKHSIVLSPRRMARNEGDEAKRSMRGDPDFMA